MPIPPEDLAAGRAAFKRVKEYESKPPKRYLIYLLPACWLASSGLRCEVKASYWNLFQVVFWLSALIWIVVVTEKRSKVNSQDHVILEDLRKKHGADINFEETNIPIDSGEKNEIAIKERAQRKKHVQLTVLCIGGAAMLVFYIRYFAWLYHK